MQILMHFYANVCAYCQFWVETSLRPITNTIESFSPPLQYIYFPIFLFISFLYKIHFAKQFNIMYVVNIMNKKSHICKILVFMIMFNFILFFQSFFFFTVQFITCMSTSAIIICTCAVQGTYMSGCMRYI